MRPKRELWVGSSTWALTALLTCGLAGADARLADAHAGRAALSVSSDPDGAQVYLDGKVRGVTPLALSRVAVGEHRVTVRKHGFLEHSQVVTVGSAGLNGLRVSLTPAPPSMSVAERKGGVGGAKIALIAAGAAASGGGVWVALSGSRPPAPGAISVTPDGAGLAAATELTFTAQGASDPAGKPLSYSWDLGDGSAATGQSVAHVYSSPATVSVRLTVSNGKKTSVAPAASVTIKSISERWLYHEPAQGTYHDLDLTLTQTGATIRGTARWIALGSQFALTGRVSGQRHVSLYSEAFGTLEGEANADITRIAGRTADGTFELTRR